MFAPALGFLVAEPTPHLIPGAIKKTTVLIIIIIFPRGWTITSLAFASAATIYAARGRIGHAVAARSAATLGTARSEEHTSELQSLMRHPYAVFCFKTKKHTNY